MEQLSMLNLMQPQSGPKTSAGNKNSDPEGFQKLMEQSQASGESSVKPVEGQTASGTEEASKVPDVTAEGAPKLVQDDPAELEKQMVLAAMAMLQNPVVPVEQIEIPEEAKPEGEGLRTIPLEEAGAKIICVTWPDGKEPEIDWENHETGESGLPQWLEDVINAGGKVQIPEEDGALKTVTPEELKSLFEKPAEELMPKAEVTVEADAETETDDLLPQEGVAERPVFEDVQEVPVKVGEAPAEEKPHEPVEIQVGKQLEKAITKGETKLEIQLEPENLGKIRVEMTLREDGGLLVQLHAENGRTQGLLEKNLSGLEALLGRNTQQEVQVEVPKRQEGQQQNLFDQEQKEHQQRQQQRREQPQNSEDFLQQLRLGLIAPDGEL